ncbi:hypothetical protein R1sor_010477 [Riccia sorocarpa]|uniref:Uncharacterized protein n=1 Tax=Riccia sorocarpa TaxID=122646 RepID=A0ABD3I276_9MARC
MEGRLRSYVDAAKESQPVVLQDHEREKMDRASRAFNLRIVRIPKEEQEDVKIVVTTWLHETLKVTTSRITRVSRIGRTDCGRETKFTRLFRLAHCLKEKTEFTELGSTLTAVGSEPQSA